MKRTLVLKRETLAVLDTAELAAVAGAAHWTFPQCQYQMVTKLVGSLPTDPCA